MFAAHTGLREKRKLSAGESNRNWKDTGSPLQRSGMA